MWLFTETGFISAVRKPYYPEMMVVRGRDKESLYPLQTLSGADIITSLDSDYPHRIVVTDEVFKNWVDTSVDDLDYDNFKNRVAKSRGYEFAHVLSNVWADMLEVTELEKMEADGNYVPFRRRSAYRR